MSIFDSSKNIVKSKTFWVNVAVMLFDYLTKHTDALKDFGIDPETLLAILGFANIILRRFTSTPVTIMPKN